MNSVPHQSKNLNVFISFKEDMINVQQCCRNVLVFTQLLICKGRSFFVFINLSLPELMSARHIWLTWYVWRVLQVEIVDLL